MDAFLRHLRDGRIRDGIQAPLALLERPSQHPGGSEVFQEIFSKLCAAIAGGRAQASRVSILASALPPSSYIDAASGAGCSAFVVDGYSDPWRWNRACSGPDGREVCPGRLSSAIDLGDLLAVEEAMLASTSSPGDSTACLVLDDIGVLLSAHEPPQVAAMLCRMMEHPSVSCCIASLHSDAQATQQLAGVRSLATARAALGAVPLLHLEVNLNGDVVHGCLEVRIQRRTGRAYVEQQLYGLRPGGGVDLKPMPQPPTVQQLASAAVTKSEASKQEAETLAKDLMKQMVGGMKLTMTEEERAAKKKVVLPYEHRGNSSIYQADDFRQYLPPAAGGAGAGSGREKLGHILYVRDSDDEMEYDSDEDPDDDLDI